MVVDTGVLSGVVGLSAVLVLVRPTWRAVRYPVTAVHELGHLVTAMLLGGRVGRVRLRADTSGLTTWRAGRQGRGRSGLIALSGPAMPPLVGAGCAAAFASGRATLGVLVLAALVGTIALVVRNLWGLVVCAALGAVCWWGWHDGNASAQVLMLASATVLCLGGVRAVTEEMTALPPGGRRDTQVAAAALWLPPALWGTVLLAWAVAWTGWATWQVASGL
jgi:hypothetical protein